MIEIKAPSYDYSYNNHKNIFLAGSIDMGAAVDWQTRVSEAVEGLNVNIFNPRRGDWDSSWDQSIENEKFYQQVSWELEHLESADLIVVYFDPSGAAPITLLELGLFSKESPMIVCCPEGYWRKGNVDIVCERYGVNQVNNIEELIEYVKGFIVNG